MGRRITRAFSKDLKALTIKIVKVNEENYKILHHRREFNHIPNELEPKSNDGSTRSDKNNRPNNYDGTTLDHLQSCVERCNSTNDTNVVKSDGSTADATCKKSKYYHKRDYKYRSIVQQLRLVRKQTKSLSMFRIRNEKSRRLVDDKNDEDISNGQIVDNNNDRDQSIFNWATEEVEPNAVANYQTSINHCDEVIEETLTEEQLVRDSGGTNCPAEMDDQNENVVPIDASNMAAPLTPPSTPKRNYYKKQLLQLHQQQEAAAAAAVAAALLEASGSTSKIVPRKRTVSERDGGLSILERVPQVPAEVFIPEQLIDDCEPIRQRLKNQGNEKISLGPNRLLLRNELLHIKKVQNEVHSSMITPPAEEEEEDNNTESSPFDYLNNLETISDEESNTATNSDVVRVSPMAVEEEESNTNLRWRVEWMQSSKRCVKIQRKLQELIHLMYQKFYRDNINPNRTYNCNYAQLTDQLVSDDECESLKKILLDLSLLQRYNYLYPDWEIAFVGKMRLLLEQLEAYEKKKYKDFRTTQHMFMSVIFYILEHNLILPKVLDVYPHLLCAKYDVLLNIKNRIRYDCENFPGNSAQATDVLPLPETNTSPENHTRTHQRIDPLPLPENHQANRTQSNQRTDPITTHPPPAESALLNHHPADGTRIPQDHKSTNISTIHTPPTIQLLNLSLEILQSNIAQPETVVDDNNGEVEQHGQHVSVIKSTAQACKEFKYEPKPGWITKAEIIPYLNGDYLVLHPAKRRRIVRTYKPIIVLSDSDDDDTCDDEQIDAEPCDDGNNLRNSSSEIVNGSTMVKSLVEDNAQFNEETNFNTNIHHEGEQTLAQYHPEAPKHPEHQTNRPQIHTQNTHIHPTVAIHSSMNECGRTFGDNLPRQHTTNNFRNINSLIAAKEPPSLIPNTSPIIYQRSSNNSGSNNPLENQLTTNQHPLAGMIFNERMRQYGQLNNASDGGVRPPLSGETINPQAATYAPREFSIFQRQLSQLSNSSGSGGGSINNGDRPATLQPQGYVLEMKSVEEMNIPVDFKNFYEFVTKSQITNGNEPIRFTTFLELHNAGNLKTYQKKYVEYLKMKERHD